MSDKLIDNIREIKRQKDEYIVPENIKSGVSILGVDGELEEGRMKDPEYTDTLRNSYLALGGHTITVQDGTSDIPAGLNGNLITITANTPPEDKYFNGWMVLDGGITLSDALATNTTFVMPNNNVVVKSTYIDDVGQKIYGVRRRLDATTTSWERTNDSVGMVANAMTSDDNVVVNDFDDAVLYKDIVTQAYNRSSGTVVSEYGDNDFTFSPEDEDVVILTYYPEFYYNRWKDSTYEYIQLANYQANGFHYVPSRRISRYPISRVNSNCTSKTGTSILYTSNSNQDCVNEGYTFGQNFCLLDIWSLSVLQLFYIVEYADYDFNKIFNVSTYASKTTSGTCDSYGMRSGSKLGTDDKYHMIYRGIENILFTNTSFAVAGVLPTDYSGTTYKVNTDYTDYRIINDNYYGKGNYTLSYNLPSYGACNYISSFGVDENYPLVSLPSSVGNDENITKSVYWNHTNMPDFYDMQRIPRFGKGYYSGNPSWLNLASLYSMNYAPNGNNNAKCTMFVVQYDTTAI